MPVTVAQSSNTNRLPARNVIRVGSYWFVFYQRTSDNYLVYKSSSDGVTWGSEYTASHAAASPTYAAYDFGVHTDGINILICYPVGTYNYLSSTAITGYTRKGTQSGGVITWSTQVAVIQAGEWDPPSMAKTTNCWYLAVLPYNTGASPWNQYQVIVWYSTDLTAWTQILKVTDMTDLGMRAGVAVSKWPQYTDGIMLVAGKYTASTYDYRTYNGSSWSALSTFATKPANRYTYYNTFSLATYGSEVHFVTIPTLETGGAISYYYFVNAWTSGGTVDSGTNYCPSLSAHANFLDLSYISGGVLYRRTMTYSTHSWSGAIQFITGETSPDNLVSEQYPEAKIGYVWRAGTSSPYNIRFESVTPTTYVISGVTRDANGNALGNCIVWLFKTANKAYVEEKTSGADGNYSFVVLDNSTQYFIRSYKDGTPNVFGTTDRNLVGS